MARALIKMIGLSVMLASTASNAVAADPIRIALIEERSGARALEALHSDQGFRLGLDYATKGTLETRGRSIELIVVDDRGDPVAAATLLAAVYREGTVDLAVAIGSSEAALAMMRVAAAFKRILLVEHAHADAITGSDANRYSFRTADSAGQKALAEALALTRPELNLVVAAQDTLDGRDAVATLKEAMERHPSGAFFIASLLIPPHETDIGEAVSAEFDALHDLHGAKTLLTVWVGAHPPIQAIAATNPGRLGIRLALGGDIDPNARPPLPRIAVEGVTSYFYAMPRNRVNDWLVATWWDRYREHPDGFAAGGMAAAIALAEALEATPAIDTEALVATMEGLRFETPKGSMIFRKEDHQSLQVMYHFRTEPRDASDVPELVHEFTIPELPLPIRSGLN
jgi:branched-chain amino acid transport system substrate-binding protein